MKWTWTSVQATHALTAEFVKISSMASNALALSVSPGIAVRLTSTTVSAILVAMEDNVLMPSPVIPANVHSDIQVKDFLFLDI